MRILLPALLLIPTAAAATEDYDAARRSSAFMAAVNVCNANISLEARKTLYGKMLRVFETPSQVNYTIGVETSALNKLPPADRQAMCAAINDRIKAGVE